MESSTISHGGTVWFWKIEACSRGFSKPWSTVFVYPLVNNNITIWKSPFSSWENPLFLWSFSIAINQRLCHKNDDLGGGNDLDDQIVISRGSLFAAK